MQHSRLPLVRIVTAEAEKTEFPHHGKYIDSYAVAHEQEVYRQAMEQKEQEEGKYAGPVMKNAVPREGHSSSHGNHQSREHGIAPHHPP